MSLRVIGGDARGRRLQQPPRQTTRPLTDRAREALFNILGPGLRGGRVADLFAGSGAVGIEALSRHAGHATFVERDRVAADVIETNLALLGYGDRASVVRGDALTWPAGVRTPFDVVFTMPPQWEGLWAQSLRSIDAHAAQVLAPGAVVVSQCDPAEAREVDALDLADLHLDDQRTYGKVLLSFHRPVGEPGARR